MMLNAIFNVVAGPSFGGVPGGPCFVLLQLEEDTIDSRENVRQFVREFHGKPVMLVATDYKREPDLVGEFLEFRCERGQKGMVQAAALYKAYVLWMREEYPETQYLTSLAFLRNLEWRGIKRIRMQSSNYLGGLSLRVEENAMAGGAS